MLMFVYIFQAPPHFQFTKKKKEKKKEVGKCIFGCLRLFAGGFRLFASSFLWFLVVC